MLWPRAGIRKSPWKATVFISAVLAFFVCVRSPLIKPVNIEHKEVYVDPILLSTLHYHKNNTVNNSTHHQTLTEDRLAQPHQHYEAKDVQVEPQNNFQPEVSIGEEGTPRLAHAAQKTIAVRQTEVRVSNHSDRDTRAGVFPSDRDTRAGVFPSDRDTRAGVFPSDRDTRAGVFPSDRDTRAGVFPSDRDTRAGVFPSDRDTRAGVFPSPASASALGSPGSGSPQPKSPWTRSWGSHPLPPRSTFTERPGAHWVAFFHDQAVAAVLLTANDTMLDCVVQEVIEEWEQRQALEYLGAMMPLEPAPLPYMVHLSTLCGVLNTPPPASPPAAAAPSNLWHQGFSVLQGILPGTLWCGRSDQAVTYRHLGARPALDACCRTHDHCPAKLVPMTARYGLTNMSLKTRSHCLCDLEFYRCLKAAALADPLATTVGLVYFNILRLDCLTSPRPHKPPHTATPLQYKPPHTATPLQHKPPHTATPPTLLPAPPLECSRRDSNGGCRTWLFNPRDSLPRYVFTAFHLTF